MPNHYLTVVEQRPLCTRSASEKAWHILSILLKTRRPATPEELASRCRLFDATTALVLSLCSIPNSPICSVEEGLVTASMAAISALREFAPESMMVLELYMLRRYYWNTEFRKRKAADLDNAVVPMAKKRLLFRNENGMHCFGALKFELWWIFIAAYFLGIKIVAGEADEGLVPLANACNHNLIEVLSHNSLLIPNDHYHLSICYIFL